MRRYGGIDVNTTSIVRLTDDERQELFHLTKSGKAAASQIKHAHILLHVDAHGPHGQPFQYEHLCARSFAVETCLPF